MSNLARTAPVIVAIFTGAGLIAWGQSPPASSSAAFKPVAPLAKLMEGQEHLMGQIKDAIQDKTWDEGQTSAWVLAELANVNQYQNSNPKYRALATKMSGQCVELANILKRRDQKAAMDQTKEIGRTCKSCHDQFRKKK